MSLPTQRQLTAAQKLYQKMLGWKSAHQFIRGYCARYPNNDNQFVVLNKVELINKFLWTQIKDEIHLAINIAKQDNTLRDLLTRGDAKAVQIIALSGVRREFSFASKFAHFHNPDKFPIYDSKARKALESHSLNPAEDADLEIRYEDFRNKVRGIVNSHSGLNFHKADQYLWLKGKKLDGNFKSEVKWASELYPKPWAEL